MNNWNQIVHSVLKVMLDGDHGSTVLTVVVSAFLAANLDWNLIAQANAAECIKLAGVVFALLWGYLIGKKKKEA